jgi:hypothetical protein
MYFLWIFNRYRVYLILCCTAFFQLQSCNSPLESSIVIKRHFVWKVIASCVIVVIIWISATSNQCSDQFICCRCTIKVIPSTRRWRVGAWACCVMWVLWIVWPNSNDKALCGRIFFYVNKCISRLSHPIHKCVRSIHIDSILLLHELPLSFWISAQNIIHLTLS